MIDHLGITVADHEKAAAFYDAVLAPLGHARLMEYPPHLGYGSNGKPSFWISAVADGAPREAHIAFVASSAEEVRAFHEAAVATGAEVLHAPRMWPEYHDHYYGAFVRDPDGNNVEAVCHTVDPATVQD